jgi:hypothetical protein
MNLLVVFTVTLYFVSFNSLNSANAVKVVIPKDFDTSNVESFKGYDTYHLDGKKLNPFEYDIKDVFTRFKVRILILSLL